MIAENSYVMQRNYTTNYSRKALANLKYSALITLCFIGATQACKTLGLGKQCYTCTTTTQTATKSTTSKADICQEDGGPMQPGTYINNHSTFGGGVNMNTTCTQKP